MSQQITTQIDVRLGNRNRQSALFRVILVLPAAIYASSFANYQGRDWFLAGLLILPAGLALLVRGVYPSYVLTLNKSLLALNTRIAAYLFVLTDEYPSIESNEKIGVEFPEINGGQSLNRGLWLVKWLLAIPLYIVGSVYIIYALMLSIVAWITVVFTGTYPEWCIYGVIGTIAFWNRVYGYAVVLVTDEYPTFSL
ncbi:MAG: hypothetical protein AABY37_00540 [Actinomycetota bacterium]